MFGTPDDPYVLADTGLEARPDPHGRRPGRAATSSAARPGLYRRHCGHCHGTTGDGLGPTAAVAQSLSARLPARQIQIQVDRAARQADRRRSGPDPAPRRARHGHALVRPVAADAQIKALVEYVKYLSMRGETELRLIGAMADLSEGEKLQIAAVESGRRDLEAARRESGPRPAKHHPAGGKARSGAWPPRSPRVSELFYSTKGNCAKCHGPARAGRRPDQRLRRLEQADGRNDKGRRRARKSG